MRLLSNALKLAPETASEDLKCKNFLPPTLCIQYQHITANRTTSKLVATALYSQFKLPKSALLNVDTQDGTNYKTIAVYTCDSKCKSAFNGILKKVSDNFE